MDEVNIKEFFAKLLGTISLILLFMITHLFFGIYLGWAFYKNNPAWHNFVFYPIFILSLILLIRFEKKKWKK